MFVHVSDVEQAGLHGLSERQNLAYNVIVNEADGRAMAVNLKKILPEPLYGSIRKQNMDP